MANSLLTKVEPSILRILESFNTPRSLAVWLLYKNKEHAQLVNLPAPIVGSDSFESDYICTGLLKKSKFLSSGIDTKRAALDSFLTSETICDRFNKGEFESERTRCVINYARGKIHSLLRGISPLSFLDHCGFGPGSDLSSDGMRTSVYNKLSTSGSCTREASIFKEFMFKHSLLGNYGRIFGEDEDYSHDERAPGNRLSFVPKNAKTDRIIAVEPRWNIFFQKGAGKVLRKALRRCNIDITTQAELNRSLALQGSRDDSISTIDLSSASDSIPKSLVKELLPDDWFDVLDRLRSHYTLINGKWHVNAKFSSMGNGFTFELETLIFYAIASRHDIEASVFGDDICCRREASADIIADLESLSFRVNKDKTFVDGPFKESCGNDCYYGKVITPYYLKELKNEQDVIQFANGLSALATRLGSGLFRDPRVYHAWDVLLRLIQVKNFGPIELSGSVHHDIVKIIDNGRGWDGATFLTSVFRPRLFRFTRMGPALLSALLSPSSDGYNIREVGVYLTRRVFLFRGYTLPPPWALPLE